ncbi:type II toxin-antitoxin system PemK/MazF family toxin [Microbacterium sp. SSM24]|uniref:type II toxin-antitoxin system PemK/MazF family toxin n=1 Tax=Microbacterium sp. SSM24 TaxID=2991714 RepID=UPI002227E738|nr:type II toxin-antitoxin system PemK/MazF family toxin [Microbacterium sp. SSM24]MCW3494558.1 type II toxin-antitoxin system PemK/MazF family toxin [Microbacterium sp. SSM24]
MTTRPRLLSRLAQLFRPSPKEAPPGSHRETPGSAGPGATVEIEPPPSGGLTISYAPSIDGDPDTGEIVWTWVPYDERDGRGKDRPVLVIARADAEHVLAVRLTSKSHDGDRDYLAIGAGPWDAQGRPSWVDVEQIYRVHREGMRREASVLDLDRFTRVAAALQARYGWRVGAGE